MSKRELKKEHILCAGVNIMKEKGYNGTSVKDIVDAAAVPKGSFYNYFESKEQFVLDALDFVFEESEQSSRTILGNSAIPPLDRLINYFKESAKCLSEQNFKTGCFIGSISQEMADTSEIIRDKVGILFKKHTDKVEVLLQEAKDKNQLQLEIPVPGLAEFIFNAWEGALMRAKASRSDQPICAFFEVLTHLIKS